MPLNFKPYRFPRGNRRLTQSEIDQRERDAEWEKRHADCEDEPCDDCRQGRIEDAADRAYEEMRERGGK
jgi:hypothetical protein